MKNKFSTALLVGVFVTTYLLSVSQTLNHIHPVPSHETPSRQKCSSDPCPKYIYIAATEGSTHHGFTPIYQKYLIANNYFISGDGSGWNTSIGTHKTVNCEGSNDTWILDTVMTMKKSNEVFLQDSSFPCGRSTSRDNLLKLIDITKPKESISRILKKLQQEQGPVSLLKHYHMGNNVMEKSFDFKVIWLKRNFKSSVYSRIFKGLPDATFENHAIMMAAHHLYIASEIQKIEMVQPDVCEVVVTDKLHEKSEQIKAIKVFNRITPGKEDFKDIFDAWRKSSKDPRELAQDDYKYLESIELILEELLNDLNICDSRLDKK